MLKTVLKAGNVAETPMLLSAQPPARAPVTTLRPGDDFRCSPVLLQAFICGVIEQATCLNCTDVDSLLDKLRYR